MLFAFRTTQISPGPWHAFSKRVMLWDSEKLRDAAKRYPPFEKGDQGIFIHAGTRDRI